ncbi:hypothetical protein ABPG77_003629 [Micractinium sp. CCAP 211/92]
MACTASALRVPTAFKSQQQAPQQRQLVVASAARTEAEPSRRSLLAAGLALLAGVQQAQQAQAAPGRWDGESSAIGSCPLGDEGIECRQAILLGDKSKLASYEETADNVGKVGRSAYGVPVAQLNSKYAKDTVALTDKILAYASFEDPTDPERFQVIKQLKAEMPAWVSAYARGGSVRSTSARKIYVVVDAISAHFASNGLAPIPPNKLRKLVADVEAGLEALAEGK